ncbi:DoxX family protein [Halorubrum gandharaense]
MATQRKPAERTLETELFGQAISFDYSETWVGYSLLSLRLVIGYVILSAGLGKLAEGGWTNVGGFSAEGFLVHGISEANPLQGLFLFFAEHLWLIDPLVMGTQILIGLALVVGVFFRLAALGGAMQMLLFLMGAWEGGLMAGLPVANGYVIDSSFVYALLLFGLGAVGAGRILGLDAKLEDTSIVKNNPGLRYLLG